MTAGQKTNVDTDTMRSMGMGEPGLAGALMQCSLDCIKILTPEGTISYMSSNGLCAMEIVSLDDVIGKLWWTLWPDDQQDLVRRSVAEAGKGYTVNFVADCPTGRGNEKRWDVTVAAVVEPTGTVTEIVAVSRATTAPPHPLTRL